MQKLSSFLLVVLFLSGCSVKEQVISSSAYHIVIKNKKLKISDTGFIQKRNNSQELQLFSSGTLILDLHVKKEQVCLGYGCVDRKSFNEEFFSYMHYDSLIDEILNFQPIYMHKNFTQTLDGFEQKIKDENMDILYRVTHNSVYFKDSTNSILIVLKRLEN